MKASSNGTSLHCSQQYRTATVLALMNYTFFLALVKYIEKVHAS